MPKNLCRATLFVVALLSAGISQAADPDVSEEFQQYFKKFSDNRSYLERLANRVGATLEEVGPAYALIVGVDDYPRLRGHRQDLEPAGVDIDNLVSYLEAQEDFVEVVELRNEAFTYANLEYFLHLYFPKRLEDSPRSRFLFAFSGHGVQEGDKGYLLKPDARRFDTDFAIDLDVIKGLYGRIPGHAFQSLVLINACHSGAFLRFQPYGRAVPNQPGHWAITAGGNTNELVWHDKHIGDGSIFFEKFLEAIGGRADRESGGSDGISRDGLIKVEEIYGYLKPQIEKATDESQSPRVGTLTRDQGSFFFLGRQGLNVATVPPKTGPKRSFGEVECRSGKDCLGKGRAAYDREDYSEAGRYFWAACRYGEKSGYTYLGSMYTYGHGFTKDEARAVELFRQACDGGDAQGCINLGTMYGNGRGMPKDEAKAVELYRQACDGGDADGCTNLGFMYEKGFGVSKDEARAVELYRQGCDGGDADGCINLGVSYENGLGVSKDEAKAVELYRQACDGGAAQGCINLGTMYANGLGVSKDEARAVELYRQACDGGNARGCSNLGFMYRNGLGVSKDEARAVELYRQACDGGHAQGCANLGFMYANGLGVSKDDARAVELYRQACDGGNAGGCSNLGVRYGNGRGVSKDEARAVELYRQGCDGGHAPGCANLGFMYANGRGVAKDETKAEEFYRRACALGREASCE